MNINSISSIDCDSRNNYNKESCEGLNPNMLNNFLKPYEEKPLDFFYKNKFNLNDNVETINDLNKEECGLYAINNEYDGFKYKGDKNHCMLFSDSNFNKDSNNIFNDYKIRTFIKTNGSVDIKNPEDRVKSENYFNETLNDRFIADQLLKEIPVSNVTECLDECAYDYKKCKSVIYMEQPKSCAFYKSANMLSKKDNLNNFDVYTIKKNKLKTQKNTVEKLLKDSSNLVDQYYYCTLNNDQCFLDYSTTQFKGEDNTPPSKLFNSDIPLYNCDGLKSTNPFCTKEFNENIPQNNTLLYDAYTDCINLNNNLDETKEFDRACKSKYGNEYVFDNNKFNMDAVVDCEKDNMKKGKCKLDLFNNTTLDQPVETFTNTNTNTNTNNSNSSHFNKKFWLLLLIIFLIYLLCNFLSK